MKRRAELIALLLACILASRGLGGVVVAWWEANPLAFAWSLTLVATGLVGGIGWFLHHKRTQAITVGAHAYLAGGLAVGAARVGHPPWLWATVACVALVLLWHMRR